MDFVKRLKEITKRKGITLYKLSKETGIPQSTISSWKDDTVPSVDKLIKIVRYLGVSSDEILGLELKAIDLTENEKEMLENFKLLPEREQIKMIGKLEEKAAEYKNIQGKSSDTMIG